MEYPVKKTKMAIKIKDNKIGKFSIVKLIEFAVKNIPDNIDSIVHIFELADKKYERSLAIASSSCCKISLLFIDVSNARLLTCQRANALCKLT